MFSFITEEMSAENVDSLTDKARRETGKAFRITNYNLTNRLGILLTWCRRHNIIDSVPKGSNYVSYYPSFSTLKGPVFHRDSTLFMLETLFRN